MCDASALAVVVVGTNLPCIHALAATGGLVTTRANFLFIASVVFTPGMHPSVYIGARSILNVRGPGHGVYSIGAKCAQNF